MESLNDTTIQREVRPKRITLGERVIFTYIILGVNILLFIAMTISGGSENVEVLLKFGGKYAPLLWKGQWWRLITPIFLHIGVAHLVINSYSLFSLGNLGERLYGGWKFLFIYLVAGLWGNIFSTFWGPEHISAGASSSIFGLAGALIYFKIREPAIFSMAFGSNFFIVIGLNILYGALRTKVDNFAHIGGLIGGLLAACVVGLLGDRFSGKRLAGMVSLLVLSLLFSYFILVPPAGTWQNLYVKGDDALEEGSYDLAIEYLDEAHRRVPRNELVTFSLGMARFKKAGQLFEDEKYSEAIDEYKKCRQVLPGEPAVEFNMGLAYFHLNLPEEGLAAMVRAIELDPNFEPAQRVLRSYGLK